MPDETRAGRGRAALIRWSFGHADWPVTHEVVATLDPEEDDFNASFPNDLPSMHLLSVLDELDGLGYRPMLLREAAPLRMAGGRCLLYLEPIDDPEPESLGKILDFQAWSDAYEGIYPDDEPILLDVPA